MGNRLCTARHSLKRARDESSLDEPRHETSHTDIPTEPTVKRHRPFINNQCQWMNTVLSLDIAQKLSSESTKDVCDAYMAIAQHTDRIQFDLVVGCRFGKTPTDTLWLLMWERMFWSYADEDKNHECYLVLVQKAFIERLKKFDQHGWNLNVASDVGWTSLHYAVNICRLTNLDSVCMTLLEQLMIHSDSEARDADGDTALVFAFFKQNKWEKKHFTQAIHLIQFMVDRGANPSSQDNRGRTLLHNMAYESSHYQHFIFDFFRLEIFGIDWTLHDVHGRRFDHAAARLTSDEGHENVMASISDEWVTRCMSFLRTEVHAVIHVKPITDLILEYIDGSGTPWEDTHP
jgi:hypothetical protein